MKPVIYLLCGLGGSGKSTYAQQLVQDIGLRKFSLDEEVYRRHGRGIVELPEAEYLAVYRDVKVELDAALAALIRSQHPAVLDYGFWRRKSRDEYKQLIESHGGQWRLVYLKASPDVLRRRLAERNKRTDANAFPVTEAMLNQFIARFEEPHGEGEEVIEQM